MKLTLSWDKTANQFKTDLGTPPKRFRLGSDRNEAMRRKLALNALWGRQQPKEWTDELFTLAKSIAKGEGVTITHQQGETPQQFSRRESAIVRAVGDGVPITTAITEEDFHNAEVSLLKRQLADLQKLVTDRYGAGVAKGTTVTIHAALDAWIEHLSTTAIDADTGQTTEFAVVQKNYAKVVKRVVPENQLLSTLAEHLALNTLCQKIANRPPAIKTKKPIACSTAQNVIKMFKRWYEWACLFYAVKAPVSWEKACRVKVKLSKEDRREATLKLSEYYRPEEIGILWKHALPVDKLLILLGLNFGFVHEEILDLELSDLQGGTLKAIRGKSFVFSSWPVWEETKALAETEFSNLPKRRQHIYSQWERLTARIRKEVPEFKKLPFKWLRKTGTTLIQKISSGEIAKIYLSHGGGANTSDKLLGVYAEKDWEKLANAVQTLRTMLLPHLQHADTAIDLS